MLTTLTNLAVFINNTFTMTQVTNILRKSTLILLLLRGLSVAAQTDVIVTNEAEINTAFQEYSPAFYQDGLVFIASNPAVSTDKKEDDKTGKTTTSIFWAKKGEKSLLLKPVPFAKELTTKFYDGPLSFSTDANAIFFTRSNVKRNNPIRAKDGLVKLKIYSAQLKGDIWTNISELPFNNTEFDCAHPSVSPDGRRLYFSSNRPGGFGGMDLYVSTFINNKWSDPVNLGPKVNTDKNDVFPFIHTDGKVFFTSNGRKDGIGGLDIYFTMKTDTGWLTPQLLPEPINSRSDDFGIIVEKDKKTGYFSSNRAKGLGDDDIFSFEAPQGIDANFVITPTEEMVDTKPVETTDLKPNTEGVVVAVSTLEMPKTEGKPIETEQKERNVNISPKVETVKIDVPTVAETTKMAQNQAAEPQIEKPIVDAPKTNLAKFEKPKVETAKAEIAQKPIVEKPKVEVVEKPILDEPKIETAQKPSVEQPKIEAVKKPILDESKVEMAQTPIAEQPKIEAVKKPILDEPKVEMAQIPIVEQPKIEAVKKPILDEPKTEIAQEPVAEQPKIEIVGKPVSEITPSVLAAKTEKTAVTDAKIELKPAAVTVAKTNVMNKESGTVRKKFLVVVGTYASRENAFMQQRIAFKAGYEDVEIIHYEGTKLYGVCVKQCDNNNEAQTIANTLTKQRNIPAFVKVAK